MTDPATLAAADLSALVLSGAVSAVEVTQSALDRVHRLDGLIGACTEVLDKRALDDAADLDRRRAQGDDTGPLSGVPIVVKNLFDVDGVTTLAGAQFRRQSPPATRDAAVVARLRAAGAILLATTNMDEFAYGFTTENQVFGTTRNPRALNHLAGGSSGGSAAAVAAGMAHIGLGSDTNGSIRVPASFCGVYGLKPTFGRLSRTGAYPFVASLDHVGPLTRSVGDLALAYDAMQGFDPDDAVCEDRPGDPVWPGLAALNAQGLRVGILDGWFQRGAEACALEAVETAARCLGGAARVELPQSDLARAAAFIITAAEGGAFHLENLRSQPDAFDPGVRDRLLAGALIPAAMVLQAQRFRRMYQATCREVFRDYDVLLAPATPCRALAIGQKTLTIGGVDMLARAHIGIYTQPLSFVGLPIMTAPIPQAEGLPIGIQIVAAPWREAKAFQAAAILEREGVAAAPVAEW